MPQKSSKTLLPNGSLMVMNPMVQSVENHLLTKTNPSPRMEYLPNIDTINLEP